ncbi:ABC1 kinase family protein [Fodinicurvata halophila]|uniref:ABC1 kinase family protein n=1 Tax=Fodinicurvata halophila TaxID=1419723 RepID=UPI00363A1D67
MRTLLSFPFRLLHILRVLTRHDALAVADAMGVYPALVKPLRRFSRRKAEGRPGQKLARALGELGPSFIKMGQFLATRADLVGEDVAGDLAELQDRLPPFSFEEARDLIEDELGQPLEELFEVFDRTPISAASIAQVHFAVTRPSDEEVSASQEDPQDFLAEDAPEAPAAGREVAVKILRPGIEHAFERDLQLFYLMARMIERSQPPLRRFGRWPWWSCSRIPCAWRWISGWRPPRPPSWPTTSPTTPTTRFRPSTGSARPSVC